MKWTISHQSALEFWRKTNAKESLAGKKLRSFNPTTKPFDAKELKHESLRNVTEPIHVLVGSGNARKVRRDLQCHVSPGKFPDGSFVQIASGLIISSPELCFLQMAGILSLVDLVALGFEFYGSYRLDKDSAEDKGFRGDLPLTNVANLQTYATKTVGLKGRKKALRALNFITEGSASPMETILTMLLTLPYRYGGYGFNKPLLNCRINVPTSAGQSRIKSNKSNYYCDLFWPVEQVAAEYDSDAFHTGSDRILKDAIRRNTLASIGVTVVTVSRRQIVEAGGLRDFAEILSKLLGKRFKYSKKDFFSCQNKLRLQLLPRVSNRY